MPCGCVNALTHCNPISINRCQFVVSKVSPLVEIYSLPSDCILDSLIVFSVRPMRPSICYTYSVLNLKLRALFVDALSLHVDSRLAVSNFLAPPICVCHPV